MSLTRPPADDGHRVPDDGPTVPEFLILFKAAGAAYLPAGQREVYSIIDTRIGTSEHMQLHDVIDTVANLDESAPAVWFEGRWWSWREVNALGDATLAHADHCSVGHDESIGVVVRNDPMCV